MANSLALTVQRHTFMLSICNYDPVISIAIWPLLTAGIGSVICCAVCQKKKSCSILEIWTER